MLGHHQSDLVVSYDERYPGAIHFDKIYTTSVE